MNSSELLSQKPRRQETKSEQLTPQTWGDREYLGAFINVAVCDAEWRVPSFYN